MEELAELHHEAAALVCEVIAAGERLHEMERWAGASFDEAATSGDEDAVDRAVAAALESDRLRHSEVEATGQWVAHRVRVEALLEQVAAVLRKVGRDCPRPLAAVSPGAASPEALPAAGPRAQTPPKQIPTQGVSPRPGPHPGRLGNRTRHDG